MKTPLNDTIKSLRMGVLLMGICLLFVGKANASHLVGGEISYQWVSGNDYLVTLALYRDCSGIAVGSSASITVESATCLSTNIFTLNQIGSTVQVSPICATSLPNSACNGGVLYSVEKYTFQGLVTLPFNCSDWVFSYNSCCRNGVITNLSNSGNYGIYISSTLNNLDVPFNNSVQFGTIPLNIIGVNSTTELSWNTYDVDGDSLIYELTPARDISGVVPVNLTYNTGYTFDQPFLASVPTTLNYATGQVTVTPNALQVAVMCMKVSEYRNGIFIGEVNRDFQIAVINETNNSPTLTGINGTNTFITNGCPGDTIQFDLFSNDIDAGQNVSLIPNSSITTASWSFTSGQYPVGTFTWVPDSSNVSSQPYTFTINVNDDNCDYYGTQTYAYQVYVNGCNTNEVWPGDANSDGTANLYDLLAVGLAFNDNGPVRPSASNSWIAQPCPDWNNSFISGINHKHADTDGDGTVNQNDITAINTNYGLNHPLRNSNPNTATVSDLTVTANYDTVGTMMAVNFDVAITTPVDSLYGLAFRLYFAPSLVDITTATVTYPGTIFGTTAVDMVTIDHSVGLNGYVDIALTRINQQNINGTGPVARVTIVTTDNVSGKVSLNVAPSNVVATTYSETPVSFNTTGDVVVIDPNFVGFSEIDPGQFVDIYPSPGSDYIAFTYSGNKSVNYIYLTDISGKIIMNIQNPNATTTLDVRSLSKGVYFIKAGIGENTVTKKLMIK